ncbi:MAG TPA: glycosyltransferase family 4 protein [Actinomycetota bacterium]|nr:glycosyltransferase family 4 protein [Actinomycetota bacterium]
MTPPLDVLLVSQPVSYGVAVFVRQLAEAAVVAGHRVTVACPGPEHGPLSGWVRDAGAEHRTLNMARQPGPRDLVDVWSLRRLARGRDVVHLHSSKAAALGRLAAMTLGRRRPAVIVTPHYWSWLVGGRLAPLYRWIERVLAPRCDAIVAVSEAEAAEGRAVLPVPERITVIHNGVDRERFSPEGPVADRDPGAPLVSCVGRLSEQKGQDLAIRALALLSDPTVRLRLVGSESAHGERERLGALAVSLGVADRIEWRGEVDDAAPELRAADVVVAPSRWEGMSLVFLEAMACGAATVVAEVAGSEALDGAGIVVPREDPAALARAVEGLLEDPSLRRRLGDAARARTSAYDLASTMRRNIDLWLELAPGGSRLPPVQRLSEGR